MRVRPQPLPRRPPQPRALLLPKIGVDSSSTTALDQEDSDAMLSAVRLPRYSLAQKLRVVRDVSTPYSPQRGDDDAWIQGLPFARRQFYRDLQRTRDFMAREVETGIDYAERHVARAAGFPIACYDRPLILSRPPALDEPLTLAADEWSPRTKRLKRRMHYHRHKRLADQ